ncbi:2-hydroxyacid dehydrogenase [Aeromicrobium piscarium]|uniref:D-glycerate dehydrogenase n=1 Tax=Aeromicrobium piscarium TaxID=2590901 RepID=A0A554RXE7_9ACTN|nr:D-glycerate dehydrogenase [Aeromicrobium piscarium]TSD58752.1 D-glycerate dehydrogenase [Aeromicrobium piscarium]
MARVMIIGGDLPVDLTARLQVEHEVGYGTHADLRTGRHAGIASAEAMILIGQPAIDDEVLAKAPRLTVIALRAVGYDKVDLEACARRGVTVCNTPGVLSRAVADLTVMLVLGAVRNLRGAIDHVSDGWSRGAAKPALGADLRGKTIGLVGMGGIAREVAHSCAEGFGMQIAYTSRSGPVEDIDYPGPGWLPLTELLASSDIVSLHLPHTPDTDRLIGQAELSAMRPGSFLVNTSRGALVDESALVDALAQGQLAGAALDVLAQEPPDPNHPLLHLDNVLITPHIGSATAETRRSMAELAVQNVLQVLAGQTPATPVGPAPPTSTGAPDPTPTSTQRGPR